MSNFAYWIKNNGQIMTPSSRHIAAIISKPSNYGETSKTIKDTFDKHGEQISPTVEGKAREEIMLRVIKRGYIRIRKGGTRNNQKWSVQLNRLTSKNRDYLWGWARKMLDSRVEIDQYADVYIHQIGKGSKMTKTSIGEIASGEQIKENVRIYTQEESECEWSPYFDDAHLYIDQLHEDALQELSDRGGIDVTMSKYIMADEIDDINTLNESSLSRIWQYIEDDNKTFGILSSFRKNYDRKENLERHKQLKKDVRKMGYGYIELDGAYPESGKVTKEKSIFIPKITKKDIIKIGEQYGQDTVMFKDSTQFVYIGTNNYTGKGKIIDRFKYKQGKKNLVKGLDDLFSALTKGSHKGKRFLFQPED